MKIKSIIVDDEKHGRENLAGILRQYCPDVDLLGEADSVEAAVFFRTGGQFEKKSIKCK
jgi:two-component system, LytTR family, response regulator